MFNVGGGEFLVIALVALIVLGPQRLPDAARQAGKAMADLRRLSSGFQGEIRDAFADTDVANPLTSSRRDVLARPSEASPATSSAVEALSDQGRVRRTPLRAAPAPSPAARAARTSPANAAPLPKGTRPRGKDA